MSAPNSHGRPFDATAMNSYGRSFDALLSLAQVEQITSLSRATLYRMIAAGQLDSVKLRGSRRVPESALARLIEQGKQAS